MYSRVEATRTTIIGGIKKRERAGRPQSPEVQKKPKGEATTTEVTRSGVPEIKQESEEEVAVRCVIYIRDTTGAVTMFVVDTAGLFHIGTILQYPS